MPLNKLHLKWCFGAHKAIAVSYIYELERQDSCISLSFVFDITSSPSNAWTFHFAPDPVQPKLLGEGAIGKNSTVYESAVSFGLSLT